jgi:hypothetical protein
VLELLYHQIRHPTERKYSDPHPKKEGTKKIYPHFSFRVLVAKTARRKVQDLRENLILKISMMLVMNGEQDHIFKQVTVLH